MKKIPLTQGKFTLIDDEDYDYLARWKWCYAKPRNGHSSCNVVRKDKQRILIMSRVILDAPVGLQVDHINHNPLDNQHNNLRLATARQNAANTRGRKHSSIYKGVSFHRLIKRWVAQIRIDDKNKYLGSYVSESEAARAYDKVAYEKSGEFAFLNFKLNPNTHDD